MSEPIDKGLERTAASGEDDDVVAQAAESSEAGRPTEPRGSKGQQGDRGHGGTMHGEGEQSWRNLLELDAQLFEQRKVRLLTPEARLLINLKLSESLTVTEAMEMAGVSYRGFYAVLERLKRAGLVGQMKDRMDQRVRNLRLEPATPIPPARL